MKKGVDHAGSFLIARAFKEDVEIHRVNPAFTSIIGKVNYAKRYGLSIHLAAALCIARRYQPEFWVYLPEI